MLRHRGFCFLEDTEMAKNDNLHKAKDAKNDEFYTRIEDVAEELRHYKSISQARSYSATVMTRHGLLSGGIST